MNVISECKNTEKMDMYTIKSKVFKGALTFLTFQLLCEANF